MAALKWSDSLSLDFPLMDDAHREFVALLGCVEGADTTNTGEVPAPHAMKAEAKLS